MKSRLILVFMIAVLLAGCREKLKINENGLDLTPVIEMDYTVTKTNFVKDERKIVSSPTVSREKINMKIYDNDDFRIRIDLLDKQATSYFKTEAQPGNDYPVAAYYEMMKGKYYLYDTKNNLMSENDMEELDFSGLITQLKEVSINTASIPAMITGGMLYFPLDFVDSKLPANNLRKENNDYGENYEIYTNTYTDELDGLQYTQETVVLKSNNTVQVVVSYNAANQLVSKTSFRYEGDGDNIQLKNTEDVFIDNKNDGTSAVFITLSEYDNFTIALNFDE